MKHTTLQILRDRRACERGYDLIAEHVGVDFTGDIPLETILDNNGLNDCLWTLRCVFGGKEIAQEFAIRVAMQVYFEPRWVNWANKWLDGSDRTVNTAAKAIAYATDVTADAAVNAAYTGDVAIAAAYAARAAAYAALAAYERNKMHNENTELLRSLIK